MKTIWVDEGVGTDVGTDGGTDGEGQVSGQVMYGEMEAVGAGSPGTGMYNSFAKGTPPHAQTNYQPFPTV